MRSHFMQRFALIIFFIIFLLTFSADRALHAQNKDGQVKQGQEPSLALLDQSSFMFIPKADRPGALKLLSQAQARQKAAELVLYSEIERLTKDAEATAQSITRFRLANLALRSGLGNAKPLSEPKLTEPQKPQAELQKLIDECRKPPAQALELAALIKRHGSTAKLSDLEKAHSALIAYLPYRSQPLLDALARIAPVFKKGGAKSYSLYISALCRSYLVDGEPLAALAKGEGLSLNDAHEARKLLVEISRQLGLRAALINDPLACIHPPLLFSGLEKKRIEDLDSFLSLYYSPASETNSLEFMEDSLGGPIETLMRSLEILPHSILKPLVGSGYQERFSLRSAGNFPALKTTSLPEAVETLLVLEAALRTGRSQDIGTALTQVARSELALGLLSSSARYEDLKRELAAFLEKGSSSGALMDLGGAAELVIGISEPALIPASMARANTWRCAILGELE